MYSQFRAQYPMGSLTSELLHMQQGHYVVKVSVTVGGVTLATGLSAATTLEEAEDIARARALVVIGIESALYDSSVHFLGTSETPIPAQLNPVQQGQLKASDESIMPPEGHEQWSITEHYPPDWLADADTSVENGASSESQRSTVPSPASMPQLTKSQINGNKGRRRSQKAVERSSVPPEPSSELGPVDLSDIIAQTDVELKRLGWTNTQGRQYLQQVYNKRSRQQLTDEELIEFLHELQAQAAADEPPF